MNFYKQQLSLYLVTDRRWLTDKPLEIIVEEAIINGVTIVQLREKELDDTSMISLAKKLKVVCQKYNVPFIINDRIDIALAVNADGVHLGQNDTSIIEARKLLGPDKIIGISAHNLDEALLAKQYGATYLGVGAMFDTNSKLDATSVSTKTLNDIASATNLPIVAIGGINTDNISKLANASISGIAVISAILAQSNIAKATKILKEQINLITNDIKTVLTIAGSDSSGGAGIQADLKTMGALNCYGMSAITALTAQNTTGVYGISDVTPSFLENQIDCVFNDIYPNSVKIGMVGSIPIIKSIVSKLKEHNAKNIVVDPVMVATSGAKLMDDNCIDVLLNELIPLATVITPNIPEATIIANMEIKSKEDMITAAKKIARNYNGYILIKGGHFDDNADDLIYFDNEATWLSANKICNPNTHGTGCTLSSAIACFLAKGYSPVESIALAKEYVYQAINNGLNLGKGRGPLNHFWNK